MITFPHRFLYCSQQGNIIPPSVKPGDEVLLPEYGGTKVVLEDKVYKKERKNEKLNKYNVYSETYASLPLNVT